MMNNRNLTYTRSRKHTVKTAAAALMGTALLFGAAAPFAFAAEGDAPTAVPIAVAASVQPHAGAAQLAFRSVQQTTDQLETDMQIPVISGMKDKAYQNTLNANLAARAQAAADDIAKQAKTDYDADNGSYPFRAYGITVRSELLSDGSASAGGILSFRVYTYIYTGGAHGGTIVTTYNIRNAEHASPIKLKDLFGSDYKNVINSAVKAEIAKRPDDFFLSTPFKSIADDQSFVIQDGVAYVIFQQYEIAPYAAGMPEFALAVPGFGAAVPAGADKLPIAAGGKTVAGAHPYTARGGVLMVPLRPIAEALGYKLSYVASTHKTFVSRPGESAFIVNGSNRYASAKGNNHASSGGQASFALGAAPAVQGGTQYVPIDFFTTVLGADVSYTKQAISISK